MPETQFKHHDVRFERALYADGGLAGGGLGSGNFFFVKPSGNNNNDGKSWALAKATIQAAINAAVERDVIYVAPGDYVEALTMASKQGIILEAAGPPGSVSVAPTAANATALLITGTAGGAGRARDILLRGIGLAGVGTGGGLHAKGNIRRVAAWGCKIEGAAAGLGFDVRLESDAAGSVGDCKLLGCELTWGDTALHFKVSGAGDPVTETLVQDCHLHDFATRGVHVETTHTQNLWLHRNHFSRNQNGDEPANEYVLAAVASTTGQMQGNRFPAAKATAKISVAAGVIKSGNWYSDGVEGQA